MTKIPKMLPKAELKTAAASLPPVAWVRMTAEETGGGRQLSVTNLTQQVKHTEININI